MSPGVLRSPCASIQTTPPDPRTFAIPTERAERDRVVAAEDERQRPAAGRIRDELGQPVAEVEDLREVTRVLVTHVRRLHDRRDDVARVVDLDAEFLRELLVEARVADRGRPHVDAAPARAEIERSADHVDLADGVLNAHDAEANAPRCRRARATLTAAQPRRGSSAGRALG